ncbi:MAG: alpha/beta fold hydrolase [Chroococcus sp. CMT-3BRIN-NPC107]|jgi:polyhydroxybutyrate depolymerase|nr:alpha/beta fold hydrolase [Chroococcus sp. CMT-3BRIN-NPC107]
MILNRQKITQITSIGLVNLIIAISLLGCTNPTQAQEERPLRRLIIERILKRNPNRATPTTPIATDMALQTLSYQGTTRSYYVYVPSSYQSGKPTPLVLAFHGGGGSGDRLAASTNLNDVANREGFVVVYPNGINNQWNDGRSARGSNTNTDDVGFVSALIDKVVQDKNIDKNRIYAVGLSNGGMFTQRLACQMSNKIAAFATVSAALPKNLQSTCNPGRPVPIVMINGTADRIVPWQGGEVARDIRTRSGQKPSGVGGEVISIPATIAFWRGKDGCTVQPSTEKLPDTQPDGTQVTRQYSNCRNSSQVVLYTVDGGGHGWPGSNVNTQTRRGELIGKISKDISASSVVWNFLKSKTLQ